MLRPLNIPEGVEPAAHIASLAIGEARLLPAWPDDPDMRVVVVFREPGDGPAAMWAETPADAEPIVMDRQSCNPQSARLWFWVPCWRLQAWLDVK